MQLKLYIVFDLFNKLIRNIHTSWSISRENHCTSQNKHLQTDVMAIPKAPNIFYFHDHTGVIWRYLYINYLVQGYQAFFFI